MRTASYLHNFFFGSVRRGHLTVVLILSILCYHYVANARFANFSLDDYDLIVLNPAIRHASGLLTVIASGRPIRGLSFALDYALFGLDPRGYHFHNILWHFAGLVLFYFLAFRVLKRQLAAGAAAVLFALHPIHSEAVMAIAHRKEMLAFTFMLASYHFYLSSSKRPVSYSILSLLFFILGLLSKQVVVVLPFILIVHKWLEGGGRSEWRDIRGALLMLAAAVVLLIAGMAVSGPVLRDFNFFGLVSPAGIKEIGYSRILATSLATYPRQLQYLLFPVHQSVAPLVEVGAWSDYRPWLGLALFLGMAALAFRLRSDFGVSFSLAWVFMNLIPIMNLIPASAFFAERYLYIPSAGECLLVAALLDKLYRAESQALGPRAYRAAEFFIYWAVLAVMVIAPLAAFLIIVWPTGSKVLMDRATAALLAGLLVSAVGGVVCELTGLGRVGRFLRRRPLADYAFLYVLLAGLLLCSAAVVEALVHGRWALPEINVYGDFNTVTHWVRQRAQAGPRSASGYLFNSSSIEGMIINLAILPVLIPSFFLFIFRRLSGLALSISRNRALAAWVFMLLFWTMGAVGGMRNADWSDDVRLWKSAVSEDPRSLPGWNNLGKAYMDRKRYDLAEMAFKRAAILGPNQGTTFRNLGMARLNLRDYKGAAQAFDRAVSLAPWDADSRINLANIMVVEADMGLDPDGYKKAIPHYLKIIAADPRSAHAFNNLGYCYFKTGDLEGAESALRRALMISPDSQKSRELLERVLKARMGGQ